MLEVGKRYTSPRTGTWFEVTERADGNRVAIPPGTIHRDPWNTNSAELHARGIFEPINDFIEAYAEAYVHHLAESGRLDDQDEMPLLQIFVTSRATNGRSWAGSPPIAAQKASLPLLAAFGRLRGYKSHYD